MQTVAGPRLGALSAAVALLAGLASGCGNDPYPAHDQTKKVLYLPFPEAPKSLDPAVNYDTAGHEILGNTVDTLLEYHYLERPYRLIPALATSVPHAEPLPDGTILYQFELREDLWFAEDPCFSLGPGAPRARKITARDLAFEIERIADPVVNSPAIEPLSNLLGLTAFSERLVAKRKADPAFAKLRADQQYEAVGGIEGARAVDERHLSIRLARPYPQILYWFTMPQTGPMPWEAVAYYDGKDGRSLLADHPVASGPFKLTRYEKQSRMVLEKNPNWYGVRHPEWKAPAATYPEHGDASDAAAGNLSPSAVGKPLPWLDRIDLRLEKELIPTFNKFLQGYYDVSVVVRESMDKVVRSDRLSPEMAALGIRLDQTVTAGTWHIGFNMSDRVVGSHGGERSRKLRQAMSLAADFQEYERIFLNGRGKAADSPIPPGLFGYEEDYRNPYRRMDLERAKRLLEEAGYPGGVDPATKRPLRLTFDTADTSAAGRLRYQFWVNCWRRIGLDVSIEATTFNKWEQKVKVGAYQVFFAGWSADYPDAENFLFLLWSEMARSKNNGPNAANFMNPEFDRLFLLAKTREDDAQKLELIRKMKRIIEDERPWIELYHPEEYLLSHGWIKNVKRPALALPTYKYYDLDVEQREARRREWNRPVLWPAFALGFLALALFLPGLRSFLKERR